jgi:hypothetical protein
LVLADFLVGDDRFDLFQIDHFFNVEGLEVVLLQVGVGHVGTEVEVVLGVCASAQVELCFIGSSESGGDLHVLAVSFGLGHFLGQDGAHGDVRTVGGLIEVKHFFGETDFLEGVGVGFGDVAVRFNVQVLVFLFFDGVVVLLAVVALDGAVFA